MWWFWCKPIFSVQREFFYDLWMFLFLKVFLLKLSLCKLNKLKSHFLNSIIYQRKYCGHMAKKNINFNLKTLKVEHRKQKWKLLTINFSSSPFPWLHFLLYTIKCNTTITLLLTFYVRSFCLFFPWQNSTLSNLDDLGSCSGT